MKKLLSFLGICAYVVGAIGGIGYALYSKAYFISICIVILAAMAWPTLVEFHNELTRPKR